MKKHATALREITHADETIAKDQVILDMDPGQFADWEGAGVVREAAEAEVSRAKGGTASVAKKPSPRRRKAVTVPPAPSPEPAPQPDPAVAD